MWIISELFFSFIITTSLLIHFFRIPLKNLKCLSEIQSDFTALKNMSNENDGSFSVNLQHSFLILCSECETRIQLLLGKEKKEKEGEEEMKRTEKKRQQKNQRFFSTDSFTKYV